MSLTKEEFAIEPVRHQMFRNRGYLTSEESKGTFYIAVQDTSTAMQLSFPAKFGGHCHVFLLHLYPEELQEVRNYPVLSTVLAILHSIIVVRILFSYMN